MAVDQVADGPVAGLLLLSPLLDLRPGASDTDTDPYDILTNDERSRAMLAALYARHTSPSDPFVSPLAARSLRHLTQIPVSIQAGGREALRSQIKDFHRRALRQGVDCTLKVYAGMPHVFQAYSIGEPVWRESACDMRSFCGRVLGLSLCEPPLWQ